MSEVEREIAAIPEHLRQYQAPLALWEYIFSLQRRAHRSENLWVAAEPFNEGERAPHLLSQHDSEPVQIRVTAGDLRRLRAALSPLAPPKAEA